MRNAMEGYFGAWSFSVLVALSSVAPAPQPPRAQQGERELTMQELVARRDLWPRQVAPKKDVRLSGAPSIRAGQTLRLQEIAGPNVVLDTGQFVFDLAATDTDVLERARAVLAALTPEQRALGFKDLPQRSELWPLRVELGVDIALQDGSVIPAGREVALRCYEGELINIFDRETGTFFQVEPYETDLLARARARMLLPAEDPFFVRAVESALAPAGSAQATGARPLDGADFVLVYGGRLGCSRCADFLPALAEFYERAKPRGGFELLFLSQDASAEQARDYVAKAQPPGRVIPFERRLEAANVATIPGQLLPAVYLFDRAGNLLVRNHPNGGSPSARDILVDLEKRLQARPPASAGK